MRRKEIAKKLGITVLAFMLAMPCVVPVAGSAVVDSAGDTAKAEVISHPLDDAQELQVGSGDQEPIAEEPQMNTAVKDEGSSGDNKDEDSSGDNKDEDLSGANDQEKDQMPEDPSGLEIVIKTQKKEYKTKDGRMYKVISYEYPVAEADSEAAQAFNGFYKKLRTKWKKAATENLKGAKEMAEQIDEADRYYADEVTCEITSSDENYICVLQSGYAYSMGAHGMPYRYSYIFDAKTGKKVSAASLLGLSKKQLNEKVRSLFLKKFDRTSGNAHPFYENRADVKATLDKLNFNDNLYYLKNGKIRFYTDPYVVGPYAAGFIEVAVKLPDA